MSLYGGRDRGTVSETVRLFGWFFVLFYFVCLFVWGLLGFYFFPKMESTAWSFPSKDSTTDSIFSNPKISFMKTFISLV